MSFSSLNEFMAMGGHGAFVWSAYGLAFVVIAFNFVRPLLLQRKFFSVQRTTLLRQRVRGDDEKFAGEG